MTFQLDGDSEVVRSCRGPALALSVGLLVLTGCAPGDVALDLTPQETAGTWYAGGEFSTKLTLTLDGNYTAVGWPEDLNCSDQGRTDIEDLARSPVRDFEGTWDSYGGSLSYQLTLYFPADECEMSVLAVVWRDGDTLDMCVAIPREAASESLASEEIFALRKGAPGPEPSPICF